MYFSRWSARSVVPVLWSCCLLAAVSCDAPSPTRAADPPQDKSAQDAGAIKNQKTEKKRHQQKHRANRLAGETSPYLLQHARNPVDWFPWGPEALAKAKKENKTIFLSVGYSSCHWCHVMERESFEDEEIAAYLNKNFVCIKVDREERPDIDTIYMTAVQLLQRGSGGWPMSVFMTPEGEPFFGGTYFPARDGDRGRQTGFLTVVKTLHKIWTEDPKKVKEIAVKAASAIKEELDGRRPQSLRPLDEGAAVLLMTALEKEYDSVYGGFGFSPAQPQRPKFPEPSNLHFLIHVARNQAAPEEKRKQAERMLFKSLDNMLQGGIYDHIGGGFHRYSVDRYWRIPHFEKMLYDNGQLASVYAEAFEMTGRPAYRRVAVGILEFVLREMTDQQDAKQQDAKQQDAKQDRKPAAFYAALDADSGGEEGKFYRWTKEEVDQALTKPERKLFAAVYGLNKEPNFEDEFYAPQLAKPLHEIAAEQELDESALEEKLTPIRRKLLTVRSQRERPLTDTKILTSWNGLMIRGFADAGRILKEDRYVEAARRAAEFALEHLRTDEGRLRRTYSQGEARLNGYLNDYAFFANGLIALHRATGDDRWLTAANELTTQQIDLFWDEKDGGFFFTSDDHESLLARGKRPIDGAQPSGNSVAAENLAYLAHALKNDDYLQRGTQTVQTHSGLIARFPSAAPRMVTALLELLAQEKNKKE